MPRPRQRQRQRRPRAMLSCLARWMAPERGDLSTFRRFVGVLLILIAPGVYSWSQGGPGPYRVPAWWLGAAPIVPPVPPPAIDVLAWSAYAAAALALILGHPGR